MSKKKILIILILLMIFIIGIILYKNYRLKVKLVDKKENSQELVTMNDIEYDEEKSIYYLRDKKTGEIVGISKYKEDLNFYVEHPDYNPNPLSPKPTDLNSHLPESQY